MKFLLYTFSFLLFCIPFKLHAVGVGATPSEFAIHFDDESPQTFELTVFNVSDEKASFHVYPDEFQDWITFAEPEFILEGKANRVAQFTVVPQINNSIATNISIVAEPVESRGFVASSGIKVPIRVQGPKEIHLFSRSGILYIGFGLLGFAVILIILLGVYFIRNTRLLEGHIAADENIFLQGRKGFRRWFRKFKI